jgi:rubredoxin
MSLTYHPDPAVNAEIMAEALEVERLDLSLGYEPRWWVCPDCGASHHRGHFQIIGIHRCMKCGYVGDGGTMHTNRPQS